VQKIEDFDEFFDSVLLKVLLIISNGCLWGYMVQMMMLTKTFYGMSW
jgi:hypothetical protein